MLINKDNVSRPLIKRDHRCLRFRDPARRFSFMISSLCALALIYINITKAYQVCSPQIPQLLCVANRHCAYQKKSSENSIIDWIPFISNENQCVKRSEYSDIFKKGLEATANFANAFYDEEVRDSLVNKKYKNKRLGAEFTYEFDEVVFLGLTRYELGLWLIFIIFFFLRKYLMTCGNRKTAFDFMHASKSQISNQDSVPVTKNEQLNQEELRKLRAMAFAEKKKK